MKSKLRLTLATVLLLAMTSLVFAKPYIRDIQRVIREGQVIELTLRSGKSQFWAVRADDVQLTKYWEKMERVQVFKKGSGPMETTPLYNIDRDETVYAIQVKNQ